MLAETDGLRKAMTQLDGCLLRCHLRLEDYLRSRHFSRLRNLGGLVPGYVAGDMRRVDACANYLMSSFSTANADRRANSHVLRLGLTTARRYVHSTKAQSDTQTILNRTIVLKKPVGERERGVLLVLFEAELMKLVLSTSFPEIERRFQILFLPTWQPFFSAAVLLLAARATRDFFLMPSGFWESGLCKQLSARCHPLPFHAASWVNEDLYEERTTKDIDIIMVANFNRHKRHWKLFEAIADLPKDLVIVLAGVPMGDRTREVLLNEARAFGVDNRITIHVKPSDAALANLIPRARIMCALTQREGPYVAVAEALMAGVPVGMYENALIGTSAYINEKTGVLFSTKRRLSDEIASFLHRSSGFAPREWARANIAANRNATLLNTLLRDHVQARGEEWTVDLERFYAVRFEFRYYDDDVEARFADVYEELNKSFRVVVARPHTIG